MTSESGLREVTPTPIENDETRPLLDDRQQQKTNGTISDGDVENGTLEAQVAREQREIDAATTPIAEEPSTKKLLLTMSGLWLSTFFVALDGTIVATLSGPISASFNSFTLFSWLASGYLIANAAFQPLSGKLTDIYGRKAGLAFASTLFALGTLMCGLAQSAWVMILGRVVAGSGGGCLNTISVFIASDLVPLRRRGVWQGIGNIVFGTGMGLGGVYGGFLNDTIGWRWAFYIQVPFIIIGGLWAFFIVNVPVKVDKTKANIKRVDFPGAFFLSSSLILFLLGLNSGGNLVPWNHPIVYVSLPLSAICIVAFVFVEDRVSEPIIPVRLLLKRTVAAACLTNWFETMSIYALLYYGPVSASVSVR